MVVFLTGKLLQNENWKSAMMSDLNLHSTDFRKAEMAFSIVYTLAAVAEPNASRGVMEVIIRTD